MTNPNFSIEEVSEYLSKTRQAIGERTEVLKAWQLIQNEYKQIDEAWKSVPDLDSSKLTQHLDRLDQQRSRVDQMLAQTSRTLQALLQREQVALMLAQQSGLSQQLANISLEPSTTNTQTYELNEEGLPFVDIREDGVIPEQNPISDPIGSKRKAKVNPEGLNNLSKEDEDLLEYLRQEEEKEARKQKKSVSFSSEVDVPKPKQKVVKNAAIRDEVVEHEDLEAISEDELEEYVDFKEVALAYHKMRPKILGLDKGDKDMEEDLEEEVEAVEMEAEPVKEEIKEEVAPKKISKFKQQMLDAAKK